LAALQLLSDEPEAFDLRLRFREVDAFGRECPDHPLQRLHIVVLQITKIDVHELDVYADSRASSPIRMPVTFVGVIIPPRPVATAARVRASRRRQSASTTAPSSAQRPAWADVRRPEEYAVLEPLGEEAGAISEHNFDKVGLPTPEHEAMAG
jgi:hypothetical protein